MSQSLSLYSSQRIDAPDFVQFIHELGGEITDDGNLDARITSNDSHVWFYGVRRQLEGQFETPEDGVAAKLGHPVQAGIDVSLSHNTGSEPLALLVAHEFARRWPAVATCTANAVITARGIERLRAAGGAFPSLYQPDIRILSATAPLLTSLIDEFSGLNVDSCDLSMVKSAIKELKKLSGAEIDPANEKIIGLIPCAEGDAWIVSCRDLLDLGEDADAEGGLLSLVKRHFDASSAYVVRVVVGYGASDAAIRTAITFVGRVLRPQASVMIGLFHFILDLEELTKARASGQGFVFEVS
jgi:hypothetical protein